MFQLYFHEKKKGYIHLKYIKGACKRTPHELRFRIWKVPNKSKKKKTWYLSKALFFVLFVWVCSKHSTNQKVISETYNIFSPYIIYILQANGSSILLTLSNTLKIFIGHPIASWFFSCKSLCNLIYYVHNEKRWSLEVKKSSSCKQRWQIFKTLIKGEQFSFSNCAWQLFF